jgi:hypothetical protein
MGNGLGRDGGGGKGDGTSSKEEGRVLEGAMEAPRAASLQARERATVDIKVNNATDNFGWIMILPSLLLFWLDCSSGRGLEPFVLLFDLFRFHGLFY